jgi:hypothetical protein
MTDTLLKGVWLSDVALDVDEGAAGDQLLLIEVPDDVAAECEVPEEGKPYREFLILAEILSRYGPPRLVPSGEEAELPDSRTERFSRARMTPESKTTASGSTAPTIHRALRSKM